MNRTTTANRLGIALLACAGAAFAVHADDAKSDGDISADTSHTGVNAQVLAFDRIDSNQDNQISQIEAQNASLYGFEQADRNNDGVIDRKEYAAFATNAHPSTTASTEKTGDTAQEAGPIGATGSGGSGSMGSSGEH